MTVCLLNVPVHKTGAAFTKPVDQTVGQAINAWEKVRPPQTEHYSPVTPSPETTDAGHAFLLFQIVDHRTQDVPTISDNVNNN
jgi:hypothetical protein